MKPRRIYYRKKKNKIVIEGKAKGKTVFFMTLPTPEKLLWIFQENASYFPTEKWKKIEQNIKRLDNKTRGIKKEAS